VRVAVDEAGNHDGPLEVYLLGVERRRECKQIGTHPHYALTRNKQVLQAKGVRGEHRAIPEENEHTER
jgi:hypothetical protein